MKYLNSKDLEPLLKAEAEAETEANVEITFPQAMELPWWDSDFRLAREKDEAFQRELETRADRLNAGLWPFT